MIHNYMFTDVNEALPTLMAELLDNGAHNDSRAGVTKELMHVGITLLKPEQRELVLPSRKASIAAQIYETMWVLSGRNDVASLGNYLPRAADFSDDGVEWRAGYGKRLRNYHGVDQIGYLVDTLRANPNSRQAVATIWDPTVDTTPSKDIACNNWLNFSSRNGKLDLHVGIRSNDAMWGWSGINAFEWSTLLEIVAGMTALEIGALHFSTTSFHLYAQHWSRAEQIADEVDEHDYIDSPRFNATGLDDMESFDEMCRLWFSIEERIRTGEARYPEVEAFPEPMMQSWLRVLQWYWSGDLHFLAPLNGTRLYTACLLSSKIPGAPQQIGVPPLPVTDEEIAALPILTDAQLGRASVFLDQINALHAEKHAAYGDSWKRRGEAGILGNIARKVDRIGSGVDTSDETQADTAQDLLVYLAKYRCWLMGLPGDPITVDLVLQTLTGTDRPLTLSADLDRLFDMADLKARNEEKLRHIQVMLEQAYTLALSLW